MNASSFSDRHRFADWPNDDIPAIAAGVYAIWGERTPIYRVTWASKYHQENVVAAPARSGCLLSAATGESNAND